MLLVLIAIMENASNARYEFAIIIGTVNKNSKENHKPYDILKDFKNVSSTILEPNRLWLFILYFSWKCLYFEEKFKPLGFAKNPNFFLFLFFFFSFACKVKTL